MVYHEVQYPLFYMFCARWWNLRQSSLTRGGVNRVHVGFTLFMLFGGILVEVTYMYE